MLPDRIFFPLVILLFAGMVYMALFKGPRSQDLDSPLATSPTEGIFLNGKYLSMIQNGPGLSHQVIETDTGEWFIRAAAGQGPNEGVRSAGVFLTLPPNYSEAWKGQIIRMIVDLRKPSENASEDVTLRYYSVGRGNSKPAICVPVDTWQTCSLEWKVPHSDDPPNLQFVGIWPDTKGISREVEFRSLSIFVPAWQTNDQETPE